MNKGQFGAEKCESMREGNGGTRCSGNADMGNLLVRGSHLLNKEQVMQSRPRHNHGDVMHTSMMTGQTIPLMDSALILDKLGVGAVTDVAWPQLTP
jgi:hypothetical protein